jgi:ligand-binding sensor domain-containing protein/signal transduction histidine kinase
MSRLAVTRDANGRLELFKVDADGALRYCWQRQPGGDWSSWSSLGGSWLPGLAAATNVRGDIEVFAVDRTDHSLSHIQQRRETHDWSGWTVVGGPLVPPATVGENTDGRLEICAVDTNGVLKHAFQTEPGGSWSAWEDFGGPLYPGLLLVRRRDGAMELFGVDAGSNHLLHRGQREAGTSRAWLPWADLGGTIGPGIAAGKASDGCLQIFAVGSTNSRVYRLVQESPGDSARWLSWEDFSERTKSAILFQGGLAAAENADGRIEVFGVRKGEDEVWHSWQSKLAGGAWTAWSSLSGSLRPPLVVGHNQDGSLELFGMDSRVGGTVHHRRQISANSDWLYWSSMDRPASEYLARVWQTDEGLPNNRVQAIAQTPDGYLWVGTSEGLARFDGMQFTTFSGPRSLGINRASISALCAATDGTLWIGTEKAGIKRWQDGRFSTFSGKGFPEDRTVHAICQTRNGAIWIGSKRGLDRFQDGQLQSYTTKQGLLADEVWAICEDIRSNIWVGTSRGLNCLRTGQMEAFTIINGVPNDPVRWLCQDRGDRLWIGTDHGLVWYNAFGTGTNTPVPISVAQSVIRYQTGRFYGYTMADGLSDNIVSAVFEDSQMNLWVGTYSGLNRFTEGRFRAELNNSGMPYDQINTVFEDSWGDLWVGSREGLIRLTPKVFTVCTKRQGLSHNNVKSVLEDRTGRLWVGTWGGGLDQITEDRVRAYGTTNGFPSDLILALCEDRNGGIWVGADNRGGLSYIRNRNVTHYASRDGFPDAAVTALHQDRAGNLWVGTTAGLGRWSDGRFIPEIQCGNQRVRAICEDAAGALWCGGEVGLMRRRNGAFENLSAKAPFPRRAVSALHVDADGKTLWVGTLEGGLLRWRHERFDGYTVQQGLLSDEILGIAEDQGWLWMTSTKGIFRVRKRDLESPGAVMPCIVYGKPDGLESIVCGGMATPSIWKTADDRLCFATTKGLAIIDARNVRNELSPPLVRIEQLDLDRRPMALPVSGEVLLPANYGELEFRYTALDLRAAEKCRFRYKLDGVDPDWIEAGTRRVAHYSGVGPGSYCFHVVACNKDGVWNEVGISLPLRIRPHVWQRWWFRALSVGALLAVVAGTARAVTKRRMTRRLELLEAQHALEQERGRIAKDIHDDLGSSLTRIMLLATRAEQDLAEHKEIQPHLSKIVAFSRSTIQAMDEIVWAVNPKHDSLEGLVGYLTQYTEQFFEDTAVRCRREMPVSSRSFALPAEVRHDLFLVVKEALNNVLKHSGASEARVEVSTLGESLQIVIHDNGCGFDAGMARPGRGGNGLDNMRRRMESIGGQLEISCTRGCGTRLTLNLRVKQEGAAD